MTLFRAALAQGPRERWEPFVRSACSADAGLERELLDSLEQHECMGDFLANPVVPRTEPTRPFEAGDLIADRFGVVRQVGEGGMAMVYEAIDEKLGERRALKCQRQMPRPEIVNVCTPTSRQSAPPRRPDPQQVANSPGEVTVGGTVVPAINQIGWLG